jgi:acyl dehydratase
VSALADAAPGQVFRGRPFRFTLPRVLAFSGGAFDEPGWPQRNLHTDAAKAREAGLPDIIVSGTQFEGLLLGHLARLVGPAWHRAGELEARIAKSALVGDEVTPVAVLRGIEDGPGGRVASLEVWCETQDGSKVLVGEARALLEGAAA